MSYQTIYACPKCRTLLANTSYGQIWTVEQQKQTDASIKKREEQPVKCQYCKWEGTYRQARAG